MEVRTTNVPYDLIIHPGKTLAEVLEDRGMTQAELAVRADVAQDDVCDVVAGKKDISAEFAKALECALDIPKSFWINLQRHYDAELEDTFG